MHKQLCYVVVFIFFFAIGFAGSILLRYHNIARDKPIPFIPRTIVYTPPVPEAALIAELRSKKGVVSYQDRESETRVEASAGAKLVQGDRLFTAPLAQASITIPGYVELNMMGEGELNLINLNPETILFEQPKGQITYQVTPQTMVSIRSGDLLAAIEQGSAKVMVDSLREQVNIKILEGKASIALIDSSGQTRIEKLATNQSATIFFKTHVVYRK